MMHSPRWQITGMSYKMKITKTQLRKVIKEELTRTTQADVPHGWAQVLPWLAEDAHTQDAPAREVHLSDKKDTEFGFIKEKYVDDVEALLNSFFDDMVGMGMDELTAQLQLQKMIDTLAQHSKQGFIGMPT